MKATKIEVNLDKKKTPCFGTYCIGDHLILRHYRKGDHLMLRTYRIGNQLILRTYRIGVHLMLRRTS